ncbi:MAG: DUF445 family protein [Candidatus Melainabacteria bacterium]|nr:DUF445 family protein [Candidatus Melainabacteria bacterium]
MDLLAPTLIAGFFKFVFPPVFYAFHGWLATEMAIVCLFRPYEPWYFPFTRLQIPCTPGIFPKRRAKLAQAVAATITDTLLTTDDIKHQAESLVTEHNIHIAVDAFVESVLKEFRDTTKLHRLASDLAELSPTFLQHLVISITDGLDKGRDTRVANITEKIFDQVILSTRISLDQAHELAGRIMENILTTERVRAGLIALLSPQNINALDESVQNHAGAPYRLLAKIIGIKRVCYEWRNFLEKEPAEAERIISDLLKRFGIRDQLAIQVANFDLRSMPLQYIAQLKQNLTEAVQNFLLEHREDILEAVKRIEVEAMGTVSSAIIRFNPESIPQMWLGRAKQDISAFCHAYLQRELGELMEKAIPALGMYGLIARKIELFTPRQLEILIKRICRQELRWLALLGGFIGAWLGLVQIWVNVAFQ